MKDRALDSGLICIEQNERDSADLESAPIAGRTDNGDDGLLKTHAHRKFWPFARRFVTLVPRLTAGVTSFFS